MAREDAADAAVAVADRQLDRVTALAAPRAPRSAALARAPSRARRRAPPAAVRRGGAARRRRQLDVREQVRQVDAARLPVVDRARSTPSRSTRPIASSSERRPSEARISRTSSATKKKKLTTCSGVPLKRLRSSGSCVAMPDRARVQVAGAHHDAAGRDQRRRREAHLVGAEHRRDHDVAAGLQLAVGLHDDARAQVVEQQRLLGLGQADLPRDAGRLDRGQRRGAGAAVVAGDQHAVGVRLGDAGGDRADADLGDELDRDLRPRVARSAGRRSAA